MGYLRVKNVSKFCMRRESVPHRGLMTETPGTSSSASGGSTFLCSRHFLHEVALGGQTMEAGLKKKRRVDFKT